MSLAATRQENVSLNSCFGDMTISQRTRVLFGDDFAPDTLQRSYGS